MKAKKSSNWIWNKSESSNLHKFTVITDQESRYWVKIISPPSCTCPYFQKGKKVKNTCKHIVPTLLTKFKSPDNSILLPQVVFNQNQVEYLLDKLNNNGTSQQIPKEAEKTLINLSFAEQQSIFEANGGNTNAQKRFFDKLTERKDAKCCACGSIMPKNKLYVYVSGMYISRNQTFSDERKFYF